MAKAKARVKKGEPKAQQFTATLKKHFKQNAGAINLAERVKKRQGKAPAAPKDPVDARDVFSKMPESVRKAPKLFAKFQRGDSPGAHERHHRQRELREIDRRERKTIDERDQRERRQKVGTSGGGRWKARS